MKKKLTRLTVAQQAVGDWIKATFKTQKDAAEHFGVTQASVSQVVNGRRNPSAAMLEAAGLR